MKSALAYTYKVKICKNQFFRSRQAAKTVSLTILAKNTNAVAKSLTTAVWIIKGLFMYRMCPEYISNVCFLVYFPYFFNTGEFWQMNTENF